MGTFQRHVSFQGAIPKSSSSGHPKFNTNISATNMNRIYQPFFLMSGGFRIFCRTQNGKICKENQSPVVVVSFCFTANFFGAIFQFLTRANGYAKTV